jgi:hypothetical protein
MLGRAVLRCPGSSQSPAAADATADEYEAMRQRAVQAEAALAARQLRALITAGREQHSKGITWDALEQFLEQPAAGEIAAISDTVIRHTKEGAPDA